MARHVENDKGLYGAPGLQGREPRAYPARMARPARGSEDFALRVATPADAGAVCAIYDRYIAASVVTFEEQPVGQAAMAERIGEVLAGLPWLIAESEGRVVGYAYARQWHARSAYRRSVETTIYLAPAATGRGIGTRLYGALLEDLRARGLHCAIGVIALPNPGSVALHEKLGFAKAGVLREVGFKLGRWVDVGHWQLLL